MNLFDSANYPTQEPTELVAGDRWTWKRTDLGADYSPASYTLKYSLRLDVAEPVPEIEITAAASGSDFVVEVPSATTATNVAGRYRWQAYITRNSDSQRIKVGSGKLTVKANVDADALTDDRSFARICLDSVETAIKAFTQDAVSRYVITTGTGSREVWKKDTADLLLMRDRLRAEVANEEIAARVAAGLGNPKNIGLRFNRV